jgi:branched-chain amino acid transport system ATP-binding protein
MTSPDSLRVDGIRAGYGRVEIVTDVSFVVEPGEMVALVGRNGAGKTTALSAVAGLRFGSGGGTVKIGQTDASKLPAYSIVRAGLNLVLEGHRIFKEMTVWENLQLGAFTRRRSPRAEMASDLQRVCDLFPALEHHRQRQVAQLSGGQQQMVAVGQALMSRPKFLLLDEPTAGLSPVLVEDLYRAFRELVDQGLGLLIVDQSIERVLAMADRFYAMDDGRTLMDGICGEPGAVDKVTAMVLGTPSPTGVTPTQGIP